MVVEDARFDRRNARFILANIPGEAVLNVSGMEAKSRARIPDRPGDVTRPAVELGGSTSSKRRRFFDDVLATEKYKMSRV